MESREAIEGYGIKSTTQKGERFVVIHEKRREEKGEGEVPKKGTWAGQGPQRSGPRGCQG